MKQPPIKICIHSGKKPLAGFDGIPLSMARTLQALSDTYPEKDIEGIFLPCARNNPELPQIIRIIYDHKENLYQLRNEKAGAITPPIHEDFHGIILEQFPNIFW